MITLLRPQPADHSAAEAPHTEGVKYAGSKRKLLPHILRLARQTGARSVFDGFSGTTRVSQALAQSGFRVIANDAAIWSRVFGTCYLMNARPAPSYQSLFDHLNALPGRDGWFTEHYGGDPRDGRSAGADGLKKPWQRHNTRKLDAIREELETLAMDEIEKSVALTALMLAMDAVDSTLGHFAAYLEVWAPRSYRTMKLELPRLFPRADDHRVLQQDVFDAQANLAVDLAYFDPPYGSNNEKMPSSRIRYAAYYHLWTSICRFDKPALFGKAGRRRDSADLSAASVFEDFRKNEQGRFVATAAVEKLLQTAPARHILLSYSSGGRTTAEELLAALTAAGKLVESVEIDYKEHVMAGMKWTSEWLRAAKAPHKEFLFLIDKS